MMPAKKTQPETMKKILAVMPSVKSHEIEYRNDEDLKKRICEKFNIEENLVNLIFADKKKKNVVTDVESMTDAEIESIAKDNVERIVIVDYLWARQMIELGEGQFKLRKSSVTIVGAGALGNEVAKSLALLGFGSMKIIDFDTVEMSNLNRTLFTRDDIGKGKATALAGKIGMLYPYVNVKSFNKRVEECNDDELTSDVLISALDNMMARIWLSTYARDHKIPLVDGGMKGLQARVQVVRDDSPCLACTIPLHKYGEVLELKNPCQGMDDPKIPSYPTATSLVASVQANEAMKLIIGEPSLKGILVIDMRSNNFSVLKLNRNRKCFVCGEKQINTHNVFKVNTEGKE